MHPLTVQRYGCSLAGASELIDAFRVEGELLSTAQDASGFTGLPNLLWWAGTGFIAWVMPDGVGTTHWISGQSWDPISRHGMDNVLWGLRAAMVPPEDG